MDLNKLTVLLCFAFAQSDGPFDITIRYNHPEGRIAKARMSKTDIKSISDDLFVAEIDIAVPIDDRRSKERWTRVRRVYTRNLLKGIS